MYLISNNALNLRVTSILCSFLQDQLAIALCPMQSCHAVSHILCLAADFRRHHDSLIPRGGVCLNCRQWNLWGDIIKGTYRRRDGGVCDPDEEEGDLEDEGLKMEYDQDGDVIMVSASPKKSSQHIPTATTAKPSLGLNEGSRKSSLPDPQTPARPRRSTRTPRTKKKQNTVASNSTPNQENDPKRLRVGKGGAGKDFYNPRDETSESNLSSGNEQRTQRGFRLPLHSEEENLEDFSAILDLQDLSDQDLLDSFRRTTISGPRTVF